jgi:UV excision repair protein RAD23
MQNIRQMMSQNPELVQPLIQSLIAQNPAIAQLARSNPAVLLQALGINPEELAGDDELPEGAQVISVTPEEQAAIQRVCVCFLGARF